MPSRIYRTLISVCSVVILVGLLSYAVKTSSANQAASEHASSNQVTKAVAIVPPLSNSDVKGVVTFTKQDGGVLIEAELSGLTPGEHGFHIHEFGDCSKADGTCAGGHFNPTSAPHGAPDDAERHAGDFGNIKADASGKATYKRVDKMIKLNGAQSIIGRGVIVHADPDDLKSQPSGNAGARVACGVIGIADPKMQH